MAKFFGEIGYAKLVEKARGVWVEEIVVKKCYGEIIRNTRRLQITDKLNDDVQISNQLSIIADPYAIKNFHQMRYVEFMGSKHKITEVEVQFPRLLLTVGGLYNE